MKIKFYHDTSEPYNMKKAEDIVRKSIGTHQDIQLVTAEVSALKGGDPIYVRLEALDKWGCWNSWPSGYMHMANHA